MKVLKIIGKIAKWYGILTVGLWAIIGISDGFREQKETNNGETYEIVNNVLDRTKRNYKDWWNWLKG